MSKKLTPWFPASVKPERRGPYPVKPVRHSDGSLMACGGYAYWDGSEWGVSAASPGKAKQVWESIGASIEQRKSWRGLAQPPKGAKQ